MPGFPGGGGNAAIIKAIQSKLAYPQAALRQNIQGRVLVEFTVGKTGEVGSARITKGIGGGCDEAVLAAVYQLPRFTPGTQAGRPVAVSFTVPITFKLPEEAAPDSLGVYTRVTHMPELPGGGGRQAILSAIERQIIYPMIARQQGTEGIVVVNFIVDKSGSVRNAKIVRSIGGSCDEAVLEAVRHLPRFEPGTQAGRPVDVSITVPFTFRIEGSADNLLDTLRRVYPLVDEMPHLPNGGGNTAIFQAIQQALVMPAEVANDAPARKVFVGFTVGPSGVVRDVKIVRGLSASCNAAALAAVRTLPRFVGGKLNGVPASVSFTVPVVFGRLPKQP